MFKKRSFLEKLTGSMRAEEEEELELENPRKREEEAQNWLEEDAEDAELAVDVYQTNKDIIIQTMIAGVKPEDIEITVARDMIVIKGKREKPKDIDEDDYFVKELYWGRFSRSISLPQEVEPEIVEAVEKNGLLKIKIEKVDKDKKNTIKIKSV
jgi:HSP20 family protein